MLDVDAERGNAHWAVMCGRYVNVHLEQLRCTRSVEPIKNTRTPLSRARKGVHERVTELRTTPVPFHDVTLWPKNRVA